MVDLSSGCLNRVPDKFQSEPTYQASLVEITTYRKISNNKSLSQII